MTDDFEDELAQLFTSLGPSGSKRWFFEAARVHLDSATRGYQGILSGLRDLAGAIGAPFEPPADPSRDGVAARTRDRLFNTVVAARVEGRATRAANHLADQVAAFASTSVRSLEVIEQRLGHVDEALRLLGERIDDDEGAGRSLRSLASHLESRLPQEDLRGCSGMLAEFFSEAGPRVLHGDCGDGEILASLRDVGVDAYGTDPRVEPAYAAMRRGATVRICRVAEHLESLADAALSGLILSGSIDRGSTEHQLRVLELARRKLRGGTAVAVAVTEPARLAGQDRHDGLGELLGWNPKTASAWREMLVHAGFIEVRAVELPGPGASSPGAPSPGASPPGAPSPGDSPPPSHPAAPGVRPSHLLLAMRPTAS